MQQPPSGQSWPQQGQEQYGYDQPPQPLPPNTQWGQQPPSSYPSQQGQWQQPPSQSLPSNTQWSQQSYPPQYAHPEHYSQQGTYYRQPNTPPPPPQMTPQPPQGYPPIQPPPPKKKNHGAIWVIICIIAFCVIVGGIMNAGKSSTPSTNTDTSTMQQATSAPDTPTTAPTPTATPKPLKWTTIQTFSGNGNKKTAIFNTPDDWKIIWSCQGFTDGSGIDGELTVTVYDNTNNAVDIAAVNSSCKAGGTSKGDTEEHQGGPVYLDIGATGNWTIQIQELK